MDIPIKTETTDENTQESVQEVPIKEEPMDLSEESERLGDFKFQPKIEIKDEEMSNNVLNPSVNGVRDDETISYQINNDDINSSPAPSLTELKASNPWINDLLDDESNSIGQINVWPNDDDDDLHCTSTLEKEEFSDCGLDCDNDNDIRDPTYYLSETSNDSFSDDEQQSGSVQNGNKDQVVSESHNTQITSVRTSLVPYSDTDTDESNNYVNVSSTSVKGKKRKRFENKWKKNIRKRKRLSGKRYLTVLGKENEGRPVKPACTNCRLKCSQQISETVRKEINSEFWCSDRSWESKRQFISLCVETKLVSRRRPVDESKQKRSKSMNYYFQVGGVKHHVCKTFFLKTLSISETFVRNSLDKTSDVGLVSSEQRGKHTPSNKTPSRIIADIKKHIMKYPTYQSHYSRERTSKLYLGNHLNISCMYKNYEDECRDVEREVGKEWLFRKIFNEEFNLAFRLPDNDTCDTCDQYQCQLKCLKSEEAITEIKKKLEAHQNDAQMRYRLKRDDKKEADLNKSEIVVMADLQKCLPTPNLTNAQSFYLRKLWTLNYTIHCAQESWCMIWDEATAGRGGNEMASCMFTWAMKSELITNSGIKKLTIWTDSCPGQNRNLMMVLMYMYLLNSSANNLQEINHKYLLRGHTHMEVDTDHSVIERARRRAKPNSIFTCNDWVHFISTCKTKGAFKVKRMVSNDFKRFTHLVENSGPFVQRKKNQTGENFQISNAVWLQIRKATPGVLYYKNSFEDVDFKSVDLRRNTRKCIQQLFPDNLPKLWEHKKKISTAKYNDLQTLLQWVPEEYHGYFQSLSHEHGKNDFPDNE